MTFTYFSLEQKSDDPLDVKRDAHGLHWVVYRKYRSRCDGDRDSCELTRSKSCHRAGLLAC